MARKRNLTRYLLDTSAVIYQLHGHGLQQAAVREAVAGAEELVPAFVRMEYLRGVILNLIEMWCLIRESVAVQDAFIDWSQKMRQERKLKVILMTVPHWLAGLVIPWQVFRCCVSDESRKGGTLKSKLLRPLLEIHQGFSVRPSQRRRGILEGMTGANPEHLIQYALSCPAGDVAALGTFPDWFLAAFDANDPIPEAVFAAFILRTRRHKPVLHPSEAFSRFDREAEESLAELATAFAVSCSLERLKRAGLLADYTIADPFSMNGTNSCTFPEADAALYNSASSLDELRRLGRLRLEQASRSARYRGN